MKKFFYFLFLSLITLVSCTREQEGSLGDKLDYSDSYLWYNVEQSNAVDVFYILPTCVWDYEDEDGTLSHYADVYCEEQRAAMLGSYELAYEIFAEEECNFYAPYYRQITLDTWIEGTDAVDERFPNSMKDIQNAFDYYMDNNNEGKPFILAGFSQGGKGVVELLKTMSSEQYSKLVAAYVIGYSVTSDEISNYSNIVAATSADDTGVTICYSSVETAEARCAVLGESALCINPINWKTDATPAQLSDTTSVTVDTTNKVLLVKGLNSDDYYLDVLGDIFVKGNYHLQELYFYKEQLINNVKNRISNFNNK